jgi:hypothetical protein
MYISGVIYLRYIDPCFALFVNGVGLVLFSILTANIGGKGAYRLPVWNVGDVRGAYTYYPAQAESRVCSCCFSANRSATPSSSLVCADRVIFLPPNPHQQLPCNSCHGRSGILRETGRWFTGESIRLFHCFPSRWFCLLEG